MIKRNIEHFIKKYSKEYPVISIVGPRQSGKTTLAKAMFRNYNYVSLENMDLREFAESDPRGFLADNPPPVIFDEVQRVPSIFSYLQEIVDNNSRAGQYILTGSQQFLLLENISQSLAGRSITFRLYPFSTNELLTKRMDRSIESIINIPKMSIKERVSTEDILFRGMYPKIYDKDLDGSKWIENYILTYVERDVRKMVNIGDLRSFENFMSVLATRTGQLLNCSSIANAIGVSVPTIKRWISVLEASGIIFLLSPYYRNFGKRIVKSPKLYFIDTGIICSLLRIHAIKDLKTHPLYGSVFENFIISNFFKRISHIAEVPKLYFWRDQTGNEIDLLIDLGSKILPVEIKSSRTYNSDFKKNIVKWMELPGNNQKLGLVIYDGTRAFGRTSSVPTIPWI